MPESINQKNQEELLKLLNPLIEFMDKNNFHYFLVAGKDGVCSRYMRGETEEVISMFSGFAKNHDCVGSILNLALKEIKEIKN